MSLAPLAQPLNAQPRNTVSGGKIASVSNAASTTVPSTVSGGSARPAAPPPEASILGKAGSAAAAKPRAGVRARQLADIGTGELILLRDAAPPPRHGEAFTMLFQKDLLALVCSPVGVSLTALQLRVLLGVWSLVGFDNLMPLNVTDLARRLGAHRTSVSRALGALERLELVRVLEPGTFVRGTSAGSGPAAISELGTRHLRVNPHIAYRGRVQQRRDAVARDTWAPSGPALAQVLLCAPTGQPAEPTQPL